MPPTPTCPISPKILASSGKSDYGSGTLGLIQPFSEPPQSPSSPCSSIRTFTYSPIHPKPHCIPCGLLFASLGSPTLPLPTRLWPSAVTHGVQKSRTFPDGGAWVKASALISQDAGSWAGLKERAMSCGCSSGEAPETGSGGPRDKTPHRRWEKNWP